MKGSYQVCVRCGKESKFVKGSVLDEASGIHIGAAWCSDRCMFETSAEFAGHRKHCGYSYCLGVKRNGKV